MMYRSIPHTADEAFEITFKDLSELFQDLIDIIRNAAEFEPEDGKKEEVYDLSGELEDIVFDVANDLIYRVERGWVPKDSRLEGRKLRIAFEKARVISMDYRALTYHMLKMEDLDGMKRIRVVFDT